MPVPAAGLQGPPWHAQAKSPKDSGAISLGNFPIGARVSGRKRSPWRCPISLFEGHLVSIDIYRYLYTLCRLFILVLQFIRCCGVQVFNRHSKGTISAWKRSNGRRPFDVGLAVECGLFRHWSPVRKPWNWTGLVASSKCPKASCCCSKTAGT